MDEAMVILLGYQWPGNIRELKNIIERGVILTTSDTAIDAVSLLPGATSSDTNQAGEAAHIDNLLEYAIRHELSFDDLESRLLHLAVDRKSGNLSAAARLLGMSRAQLAYRLKRGAASE